MYLLLATPLEGYIYKRGMRRAYASTDSGSAFVSDVLRIKVTGPTGLHLTIADLPGLISVPNEEQTDADVQLDRQMIEGYLSSSRTIIPAVLQASYDVANQGIVQLARKYDLEGERIVRIIAKPDLINQISEGKIALLVKRTVPS
jgi:Dynamin family